MPMVSAMRVAEAFGGQRTICDSTRALADRLCFLGIGTGILRCC